MNPRTQRAEYRSSRFNLKPVLTKRLSSPIRTPDTAGKQTEREVSEDTSPSDDFDVAVAAQDVG